jgi:hypothetical protein
MSAPNVDIVFVIDASGSMQPCFAELSQHLQHVLKPLHGNASRVRFGLVTISVGTNQDSTVYYVNGLSGINLLDALYDAQSASAGRTLFTESPTEFSQDLSSTAVQGDEDMLLALDVALDFPFGPLANTKRVIAMFSDEPFETGVRIIERRAKLQDLMEKIMARHIQLFCAVPDGATIQELSAVDRSEIELISSGNGLGGIDFAKLLSQMGKSVSVSSLQVVGEPVSRRAIFGQDQWGRSAANDWTESKT